MSFYAGLRSLRTPSSSIIRSHRQALAPPPGHLYPVASSSQLIRRAQSATSRRHASNSAAAAVSPQRTSPPHQRPASKASKPSEAETVKVPLDATAPTPVPVSSTITLSQTLNAPASTRPPPLHLPTRDPQTSFFSFHYNRGKAYINFYKTGLKAIFINRKLLTQTAQTLQPPPGLKGTGGALDATTTLQPTRAAMLLKERVRHDIGRVPIFGLMVFICGEFTPLLVLVFPKLTPYTCRIPAQVEKVRSNARQRREASLHALRYVDLTDAMALDKVAPGHIARSLGLGGTMWDKIGMDVPFAPTRAARAVRKIVEDDFMIRRGGGVNGLEGEEAVLAAEARGIDVQGKSLKEVRHMLGSWIAKTTKGDERAGEEMVRKILCGLEKDM